MNRREAEALYDAGKEPTVAKLLEYDIENTQLKEKIAQLQRNSQTSSNPPSSDTPGERKQGDRNHKKRKPGGQPGHKGTYRNLIPVEEVNEIIPLYPERCAWCGRKLPKDKNVHFVGEPFRWQVTEIPPITPEVTEYQCYTVQCTCGHSTKAQVPEEIARSNFGPRLAAIIAYLVAVMHLSRRQAEVFCQTLLGVNICLGSVQKLLEEMSDALEPVEKELQEALPSEPVINADETGWRNRWLWIFVASTFVYFRVATSRSSHVLVDILGIVYQGILCVDRWGAYTKYHKGLMQICWAHLKRDFLWVIQIGHTKQSADAISFAKRMEKLRKKLLAVWYRFKEGTISREELIQHTDPVRSAIRKHLTLYKDSQERCVRTLARNLLKRFDHLFTFIFYEGVEPTNNISERGIRPAVQWRKICFGNRSDNGAVLTSRLLTATRTCWFQKRNPLEFLVDTITAFRSGISAPSLL
jgi:transposase